MSSGTEKSETKLTLAPQSGKKHTNTPPRSKVPPKEQRRLSPISRKLSFQPEVSPKKNCFPNKFQKNASPKTPLTQVSARSTATEIPAKTNSTPLLGKGWQKLDGNGGVSNCEGMAGQSNTPDKSSNFESQQNCDIEKISNTNFSNTSDIGPPNVIQTTVVATDEKQYATIYLPKSGAGTKPDTLEPRTGMNSKEPTAPIQTAAGNGGISGGVLPPTALPPCAKDLPNTPKTQPPRAAKSEAAVKIMVAVANNDLRRVQNHALIEFAPRTTETGVWPKSPKCPAETRFGANHRFFRAINKRFPALKSVKRRIDLTVIDRLNQYREELIRTKKKEPYTAYITQTLYQVSKLIDDIFTYMYATLRKPSFLKTQELAPTGWTAARQWVARGWTDPNINRNFAPWFPTNSLEQKRQFSTPLGRRRDVGSKDKIHAKSKTLSRSKSDGQLSSRGYQSRRLLGARLESKDVPHAMGQPGTQESSHSYPVGGILKYKSYPPPKVRPPISIVDEPPVLIHSNASTDTIPKTNISPACDEKFIDVVNKSTVGTVTTTTVTNSLTTATPTLSPPAQHVHIVNNQLTINKTLVKEIVQSQSPLTLLRQVHDPPAPPRLHNIPDYMKLHDIGDANTEVKQDDNGREWDDTHGNLGTQKSEVEDIEMSEASYSHGSSPGQTSTTEYPHSRIQIEDIPNDNRYEDNPSFIENNGYLDNIGYHGDIVNQCATEIFNRVSAMVKNGRVRFSDEKDASGNREVIIDEEDSSLNSSLDSINLKLLNPPSRNDVNGILGEKWEFPKDGVEASERKEFFERDIVIDGQSYGTYIPKSVKQPKLTEELLSFPNDIQNKKIAKLSFFPLIKKKFQAYMRHGRKLLEKTLQLDAKVKRLITMKEQGKVVRSFKSRPFRRFNSTSEAAFKRALDGIEEKAQKGKMELLIKTVDLEAQRAELEWIQAKNIIGAKLVILINNALQNLRYTTILKKKALINTLAPCMKMWDNMVLDVTEANQMKLMKKALQDEEKKKKETEAKLLVNTSLGPNIKQVIHLEQTTAIMKLKDELFGPLCGALSGNMNPQQFKEEYNQAFVRALAPSQALLKKLETLRVGEKSDPDNIADGLPARIGASFVKAFREQVKNVCKTNFGQGGRGYKRSTKNSSPRTWTSKKSGARQPSYVKHKNRNRKKQNFHNFSRTSQNRRSKTSRTRRSSSSRKPRSSSSRSSNHSSRAGKRWKSKRNGSNSQAKGAAYGSYRRQRKSSYGRRRGSNSSQRRYSSSSMTSSRNRKLLTKKKKKKKKKKKQHANTFNNTQKTRGRNKGGGRKRFGGRRRKGKRR